MLICIKAPCLISSCQFHESYQEKEGTFRVAREHVSFEINTFKFFFIFI